MADSKHTFPDGDARAHSAASGLAACAGGAGGAAVLGLVPSKTSPLVVTFDRATRAKKRIKRLRRAVWAAGHLHGLADRGKRPPVAWMVTLTYKGVDDWRPNHISEASERYRRYCVRLGIVPRYLWVAELQKRGAVHYHLIAWLPQGVKMPHWDASTVTPAGRVVQPFWPHGMTNSQQAKNGVGYLMKYVSKISDKTDFPPGLRLYGIGGLNDDARAVRGWYNLPEWVKREHGVGDVKRMGSRLVIKDTGEVLQPMYRRHFVPGGIVLLPVRVMPERFHAGAYSSYCPSH